jgi:hypothetical protein
MLKLEVLEVVVEELLVIRLMLEDLEILLL